MAGLTPESIQRRVDRFGKLYFVDDLVRQRGKDEQQLPILGYPVSDGTATDYEYFNGKQLDRMVDEACRAFVQSGLPVNGGRTVALYAHSDLSFVVSFFALFRLGYKVLTMSIRLGPPACLNLLDQCGCDIILHGNSARINATVAEVAAQRPDVTLREMLKRADFDKPDAPSQHPFEREIKDRDAEHTSAVLIMHSSGSTGLPKPLYLSHRSVLNTLLPGTEWHSFNPLPWYHLHGLITSIQAMYHRRKAHLYGTQIPLTTDNLIAALRAIRPEICHMVPYALKLVAEKPEGIELLKQCERVTSAGARTPDELGDRLVQEGVKFAVVFGSTEVGHMGDSIHRPPGDDSWNYIRPFPLVIPHMTFKKLDENNYESVYFKSHPALMTSNSDDPPGSFHSKDIFTPHPTIPGAWKYVARDDDRITLLSGEKILPLTMEDIIRKNPLLRDVLMVGNDRLQPGLLVFRAESSASLSDEELVKALWQDISAANAIADEFARITADMVLPLGVDVEYPATDKKNIIRAAAYAAFEENIETLYSRLESTSAKFSGSLKNLKLGIPELEQHLMTVLREEADLILPNTQTDFFAAGVDSLRAAQIRRLLLRDLDLDGQPLPTNVVYDTGNVEKLAKRLYSMRTGASFADGDTQTQESEIAAMESLIKEYGNFQPRGSNSQPQPDQAVVVLTGATGGLGAHILGQLLENPEVKLIYALVRGNEPSERVRASLEARKLDIAAGNLPKITALSVSDCSQPLLGLPSEVYEELRQQTTHIIHAAWPVNFNLSLKSFVPHILGTGNLLQLSLNVPFEKPARFLFMSSISTVFETPLPSSIAEAPTSSLAHAAPTGYARSKLVSEKISEAAAVAGADVAVARIGQIMGDTVHGIWNDNEAVPLLIRSALELGSLPTLDGDKGKCEWIPVDTVAGTCLDLLGLPASSPANGHLREVETNGVNGTVSETKTQAAYYNILPPHFFSWNEDLIPALQAAGLKFTPVSFDTWLSGLRARGVELGPEAENKLPTIKLVDYFEEARGSGSTTRELHFNIEKTIKESTSLRACPHVIKDGLVPKLVQTWLESWS